LALTASLGVVEGPVAVELRELVGLVVVLLLEQILSACDLRLPLKQSKQKSLKS